FDWLLIWCSSGPDGDLLVTGRWLPNQALSYEALRDNEEVQDSEELFHEYLSRLQLRVSLPGRSDYSAGSWRISSSSAEAGLCRVTRSRRRRNGRSTTMCSSNAAEKHVTA